MDLERRRALYIDGGQSRCRASLDGEVTTLPGLPRVGRRYDALREFVAARGVDLVAAGLTGYGGEPLDWPASRVIVTNDAVTAYLGALGEASGAVIVAGTGAIALACDGERVARADGHGTLLGDHGGGYWIGRRALALALRGDAPGLLERAHARYGERLIRAIYDAPDPTAAIAGFTPDVAEAARAGDEVAARIWAAAGRELARTVTDALARLAGAPGGTAPPGTAPAPPGTAPAPPGTAPAPPGTAPAAPGTAPAAPMAGPPPAGTAPPVVSWSGGLFGAGDLILEPLQAALGFALRPPLGDALAGAVRLEATSLFASLIHRSST